MPEVIDAAAPAVTVGTENSAPAGNGADNRSLNGSNLASQTPQKTTAQKAIAAQNALDAEEAKTRDLILGKVAALDEVPAKTEVLEAPVEDPVAEEKSEEPVAKSEEPENEDEEGITKTEDGVKIRPARLKKLLKAQADYNEMVETIAKASLNQSEPEVNETKVEAKVDISKAQTEKMVALRQKIKEAKANFDADAESAALEELMDLKADIKAEEKVAKERSENRKISQERERLSEFNRTDEKLESIRDQLWIEDQKRVEALGNDDFDLTDPDNQFYKVVQMEMQRHYDMNHPICKSPKFFRRCVEIAADGFGLELPDPKKPEAAKTAVAPAPVSSVKPNVAAHRKNGAVVTATSNGKVAMTQEQAIQQLNTLKPSDRLKVLQQITNIQQKGNR